MKPAFNAAEEKKFFAKALLLEDRIIKAAYQHKLTDVELSDKRTKKISQIILPLLKQIPALQSSPETQALAADLKEWSEMREELIKRNLGLLVVAVQRIKDHSRWEHQISDQLAKLNQAFQGFEPKLNFKFSTYAMRALFQGIGATTAKMLSPQFTNSQSHLLAKRIKARMEERFRQDNVEMSVGEIAEEFKISVHRARSLLALSSIRAIELDAKLSADSDFDNGDLVAATEYQSLRSLEKSEQRLRLIRELLDKITDPTTREVMTLKSQGLTLLDIVKRLDGEILSKQGVKLRYEEGVRALRAITAIEAGKVSLPTSKQILIDFYGLYGRQKRAHHLIAAEQNISRTEVLSIIQNLTKNANEDWLDKILESRQSHR